MTRKQLEQQLTNRIQLAWNRIRKERPKITIEELAVEIGGYSSMHIGNAIKRPYKVGLDTLESIANKLEKYVEVQK